MTKYLKNIVLLVFSVFATFLIMEGISRQFFGDQVVLYNRFHSIVRYGGIVTRRLKPNARFYHESIDGRWPFRINNMGFRQYWPTSYEKGKGIFRILFLGDSHTQGMEVDQRKIFTHLLNGKECRGKKIETINAGISGSGTSEQLVFLEYEGYRYKPDVVVLAFYLNDLDNNVTGFHRINAEGNVELRTKTHPATTGVRLLERHNNISVLAWLSQNSYAYSIIMNSAWSLGSKLVYGKLKRNFVQKTADKDKSITNRKIILTRRLIERIYSISQSIKSELHILDLPAFSKKGIVSSVSVLGNSFIQKYSTTIVTIGPPFTPNLFVVHGHKHINERAHQIAAEKLYLTICNSSSR